MIFNSLLFLGIFLPLVVAAFFVPVLRRMRTALLLAVSLIFYGYSGIDHALVLVGDIVCVYLLARHMDFRTNRWALALAVAVPALALA